MVTAMELQSYLAAIYRWWWTLQWKELTRLITPGEIMTHSQADPLKENLIVTPYNTHVKGVVYSFG